MKKLKVVYCFPSICHAGGVERVLTTKVNYLANQVDKYDVTIILTDGADRKPFYELSDEVKVINLHIEFEELWEMSFIKKVPTYMKKQRLFKKRLRDMLMELRPDITVSTLHQEINFINNIPDGSKKIGEMLINRQHYRIFEADTTYSLKNIFAKWRLWSLTRKLRRLDGFVVLTQEDKLLWRELDNVSVIPYPLPAISEQKSSLTEKRVIAVGRYVHEKGIDLLLQAWSMVEKRCPDWRLDVYGAGDAKPYHKLARELKLDETRYALNGPTNSLTQEYLNSSIFTLSSRFEGFGMVILEAMSHGLAVVSFDCPCGPKAIIEKGVDGVLVENGEPTKLAQRIVQLIEDENWRRALADRAWEKTRRYSIGVIGKQWEQLFADFSDKDRPRQPLTDCATH